MRNLIAQHHGFSLLELLLVVALIGIIAAIGTPVYLGHVDNAKRVDAKNSLSAIAMKQEQYLANGGDPGTGSYHISANAVCSNATTVALQTALFGLQSSLSTDFYFYCTEANANGYIASACKRNDAADCYTLDNLNNKSANW